MNGCISFINWNRKELQPPDETHEHESNIERDIFEIEHQKDPSLNNDSTTITEEEVQNCLSNSNEAQEFFVYNQETGQYQKYLYIPPTDSEQLQQRSPDIVESVFEESDVTEKDIEPSVVKENESTEDLEESKVNDKHTVQFLTINNEKTLSSDIKQGTYIDKSSGDTNIADTEYRKANVSVLEPIESIKKHHSSSEQTNIELKTTVSHSKVSYSKPLLELKSFNEGNLRHSVISKHTPKTNLSKVQCKKCPGEYFELDAFDNHCIQHYIKEEKQTIPSNEKSCEICKKNCKRKDYLTHLKEEHSNVLFRCPLCTQTYHSPELLNIHYNHLHVDENKHSSIKSSSIGKLCHEDIVQENAFLENRLVILN